MFAVQEGFSKNGEWRAEKIRARFDVRPRSVVVQVVQSGGCPPSTSGHAAHQLADAPNSPPSWPRQTCASIKPFVELVVWQGIMPQGEQ